MKIHPSIASSNLLYLKDEIEKTDKQYGNIHVDIEDGNYINNITFGNKLLNIICKNSTSFKSVHLMVNHPLDYLETIVKNNVDIVFLHIDHLRFPSVVIEEFLKKGIKVGIALNPNSELSVDFYIREIKSILLMMCEPDTNDQAYIEALEKKVRKYINYGYQVWCDGGISLEKSELLFQLGVNDVVLGRAVYHYEVE